MSLLDNNGLSCLWGKVKGYVSGQMPSDFNGATTASGGAHGLVPAPTTTDTGKFLKGDGTWGTVTNEDIKVAQNTTTANANYRVLLSGSADDTDHTEGAYKNSGLLFNTNKQALRVGNVNTTTMGQNSFANGSATVAKGASSHAEGYGTTAFDDSCHTEGENTYANGWGAHAEGENTYADGNFTHVEGYGTTANNN